MRLASDFSPYRPVVLLHAFPLNRRMWDAQVTLLQRQGYSPLALDLPGFGDSPLAGSADLAGFARAVLQTLDELQVRRAAWVGLSMGGYVLFRILAMAPERVGALVLADTRAEPDGPEARQRRFDQASRVAAQGPSALADSFVASAVGAGTRARAPEVAERVRRWVSEARVAGIVHALHAMAARPDSTPLLGSITVPTLVLVGREDTLTPPDVAQAMAARIPGARCHVIEGAGHLANLEAPEAFNRLLLDFLAGSWQG